MKANELKEMVAAIPRQNEKKEKYIDKSSLKNQDFDIIIQAGQSNADGRGRGEATSPYVINEDVLYYSSRYSSEIISVGADYSFQRVTYPEPAVFEFAAEREIEGIKGIFSDFSLSFAREYISKGLLKKGRKLLILRAAVSGTGFAKGFWLNGGVCFVKLMDMIESLKELNGDNKFAAFLWHQGEHDAFENPEWSDQLREKEYIKNFKRVILSVRHKCQKPDLPVIAAGFSQDWADNYVAASKAVLSATKKVLNEVGYSAFVETDDLISNRQAGVSPPDNVHFCRESLHRLGEKYFNAYLKITL